MIPTIIDSIPPTIQLDNIQHHNILVDLWETDDYYPQYIPILYIVVLSLSPIFNIIWVITLW